MASYRLHNDLEPYTSVFLALANFIFIDL